MVKTYYAELFINSLQFSIIYYRHPYGTDNLLSALHIVHSLQSLPSGILKSKVTILHTHTSAN